MHANEALVIARAHPMSQRPAVVAVRSGQTLQAIIDEALDGADAPITLRAEIGGYEVPSKLWARVRPKAGSQISLTVMPAGGGDSKKWLRVVLMIVVIVVAFWFTGGLAFAGYSAATIQMAGSAITLLGMAAVNALVPPPKPKLEMGTGANTERQFALTGSSNQINPWGAIPLVIGEMRYYPTHAVLPYTEELGADRYMRLMFDLGHGVDIDVMDIRIGETPITSFQGVEWEVTRTPTLYTDDIYEEQVAAGLQSGVAVTRTTQVQTDEISIVIDFSGLAGFDSKGKTRDVTCPISVQYRKVGTLDWITPVAVRATNWNGGIVRTSKRGPFPVSIAWDVPDGQQYEVRVTKGAVNWNGADPNTGVADCQWSGLRSIRKTDPSTTGTWKLAMRIKASEQINGTVQTLNCIVRQRIPVLVDDTWVRQPSTNPAWIMHWLLTECPAVVKHLTDSHIDLVALAEFAEFCDQRELGASMVADSAISMSELVDTILAAGMGAKTLRDGKVSIVWDVPDALPVGVFTPANYKSFSSQRTFVDMPHGLRVKFTNATNNFITDEIIVLGDLHSYRGKNARGNPSGLPVATEFETLELPAARTPQAAWRAGRYQMAQAIYRPVTHQMETDIEMLRYTRGDVVTVMDDVMDWGVAAGRVTAIAGGLITTDNAAELQGDQNLSICFVDTDTGERHVQPCVYVDANTWQVPMVPSGIEVGDVYYIGSTERQTRNLIITGVHPAQDLTATIQLADAAPGISAYISNPPDNIVSEATGLTYMDPPDPPKITVIVSDDKSSTPADDGTTAPEATVGIRGGSGYQRFTHNNGNTYYFQV